MRKVTIIFFIFHFFVFISYGQDIPPVTQQQLENLTDAQQTETEDDSYLQQLEHFKRHPLNLNTADANELKELFFLTDLQIDNLISYRKILGKLISIYELQSIPDWDIATIKRILPFITVSNALTVVEDIGGRFKKGDQNLLLRISEIVEKSKGFDQSMPGTKYMGSRYRLFFRYRYQYKDLLQFGFAADKDAGEQFFKGVQKYGFDFYSFHLFTRKLGKIQALALGDFTVNMGQGLMQWQGLAFSKSSDVMDVKRQSSILRPYSSSGEFYFHRGAGITMKFGKIETTAFVSIRKLSANFVADTINREDFISSFQSSGYHRTQSEIDDRNNLSQFAYGGNLTYRGNDGHVGINGVAYDFSLPVFKRSEPYNLFAISGKKWNNYSVDYSYTHHNFHFFGEAAADKNFSKAFLNGLLISVDPKIDLSIVQRSIDKKYQAVYGNAFTESTYPTNENGIFAGISISPSLAWRWDMYADFYTFPWLKYLVDAPSYGKDFLVQLSFSPNRQLQVSSRYRNETKQSDQPADTAVTNYLVLIPKRDWRTEINYHVNSSIAFRERVEVLWYGMQENAKENGFLIFFDFICKPVLKPFSGIVRLQYFESNSYNSRMYAYENDVLYSYSVPAFFDRGYRYYLDLDYVFRKRLFLWLRWSQTIYKNESTIGSGLDEIPGNHHSEIKLQAQWFFK